MKRLLGTIIPNVILIFASITFIYPLAWMLFSTFKTPRDFMSNPIALPKEWIFKNYVEVFTEGKVWKYMFNTFRLTAVSLIFILIITYITGFILARYEFRGRRFLNGMFMMGLLVPIHALLVPLYILFSRSGLTDRWFSTIFPNVAFGLPTGIFLITNFIKTVPRELDEAAAIDGAGFSRTMFTIILPLTVPMLVTVGIISFFACWNEFSYSLVLLRNENYFGLPLGMTMFQGMYKADYPKMITTMIFSICPALIIYFSFSKYIIRGMMAGAVKG